MLLGTRIRVGELLKCELFVKQYEEDGFETFRVC